MTSEVSTNIFQSYVLLIESTFKKTLVKTSEVFAFTLPLGCRHTIVQPPFRNAVLAFYLPKLPAR